HEIMNTVKRDRPGKRFERNSCARDRGCSNFMILAGPISTGYGQTFRPSRASVLVELDQSFRLHNPCPGLGKALPTNKGADRRARRSTDSCKLPASYASPETKLPPPNPLTCAAPRGLLNAKLDGARRRRHCRTVNPRPLHLLSRRVQAMVGRMPPCLHQQERLRNDVEGGNRPILDANGDTRLRLNHMNQG
ncbi:hypothetical protein M2194_000165, partial [Bradyrhizobium elkanii]|nr:hypothetical protein [Bradyrhizobium elkanii]